MATELRTLRTIIRQKLRRHATTRGGRECLVDGEVLLKAVAAGFSVKGDVTLEQLSDMVDARLQAEVLALYGKKQPAPQGT